MLKETFGRNLKTIRHKKNLTQEKAAELCDLSPKYWGKLECAGASVSIDIMEKIAKGFQIQVEDLLKEEITDGAES